MSLKYEPSSEPPPQFYEVVVLKALHTSGDRVLEVSGFGSWFQVHGFRFMVSSSCFQIHGFRFMDSGTWLQVNGFRYTISGSSFQVYGFRFMVPGTWFQVPGFPHPRRYPGVYA